MSSAKTSAALFAGVVNSHRDSQHALPAMQPVPIPASPQGRVNDTAYATWLKLGPAFMLLQVRTGGLGDIDGTVVLDACVCAVHAARRSHLSYRLCASTYDPILCATVVTRRLKLWGSDAAGTPFAAPPLACAPLPYVLVVGSSGSVMPAADMDTQVARSTARPALEGCPWPVLHTLPRPAAADTGPIKSCLLTARPCVHTARRLPSDAAPKLMPLSLLLPPP